MLNLNRTVKSKHSKPVDYSNTVISRMNEEQDVNCAPAQTDIMTKNYEKLYTTVQVTTLS